MWRHGLECAVQMRQLKAQVKRGDLLLFASSNEKSNGNLVAISVKQKDDVTNSSMTDLLIRVGGGAVAVSRDYFIHFNVFYFELTTSLHPVPKTANVNLSPTANDELFIASAQCVRWYR